MSSQENNGPDFSADAISDASGIRRICPRCGGPTDATARFCKRCGQTLGSSNAQTSAAIPGTPIVYAQPKASNLTAWLVVSAVMARLCVAAFVFYRVHNCATAPRARVTQFPATSAASPEATSHSVTPP